MTDTTVQYRESEPDFETIQQIVDGYFTIIPMMDEKMMYINEEGLIRKLPLNTEASKLVGYRIYGNVLVVG